MGRPRKPVHVNEASGLTRDVARYGGRKQGKAPKLGGPALDMGLSECAIWGEVLVHMWWLREHHRSTFELYVRMIARMRTGDTSAEVVSGILRCSSKLGGDPCSDQMFGEGDNKPDDLLDE